MPSEFIIAGNANSGTNLRESGILYFCTHKDDLKNKRFEKVGFILQCY
ncbi:DUF1963 domain-containing protein [Neobacillus sp.]